MKKILIISPDSLPVPCVEGGAIEQLIDEYLKYNSKSKKYNITVYSPYSEKISPQLLDNYNNVYFRFIKKSEIKYCAYKFKYAILRRLDKKNQYPTSYCMSVISDLISKKEIGKYDLIIIENQVEHIITYTKKLKQKVVLHLHNDYLNIETNNNKEIVNCLNELWGVSNFICKRATEINPQLVTRVLYNGASLEKFNVDKLDVNILDSQRKKIGVNDNDTLILYSGRLMPEKGVLELIKGFNLAKKKCPNLKLLILGKKKDNSKDINDYYDSLMLEKKENMNDIIFKGFVSQEEIRYLYAISNIQVVPSLWNEAFGMIVVEGAASGVTLITTNVGGIPEIVNSDSAIILEKSNLVEKIAESIIKLHNDKCFAKKLAENAKIKVKKFDVLNYNKNFEKNIECYFNSRGE